MGLVPIPTTKSMIDSRFREVLAGLPRGLKAEARAFSRGLGIERGWSDYTEHEVFRELPIFAVESAERAASTR